MHRHFRPSGKQKVRHYYRRSAMMDAAEDWDINTPCAEDCGPKELQQIEQESPLFFH